MKRIHSAMFLQKNASKAVKNGLLQINMHRSRTPHELVAKFAAEITVNITGAGTHLQDLVDEVNGDP